MQARWPWYLGIRSWLLTGAVAASGLAQAGDLEVKAGGSIQAAIDRANAGDTVRVYPGIYHEALHVDKADLNLQGVIVDGVWPQLEGDGRLNDGVIASKSGFNVSNLVIKHYKGNGVMTQGANRVRIHHIEVRDTGIYGIYPTLGQDVVVEDTVTSGIEDAAIYIGMCSGVVVRRNRVEGNVGGIELENSTQALIEGNWVTDNTGGILVFALPGLPKKESRGVTIRNNFVIANNHRNFGAPGSVVANVPPGTGILILAAHDVTISNNIIQDHGLGGILIADLGVLPHTAPDPQIDPLPANIEILDNLMGANGVRSLTYLAKWYHFVVRNLAAGGTPDGTVDDLLPKGGDLVSTGKGKGLCGKNLGALRRVKVEQFAPCPPDSGHAGPATDPTGAAAAVLAVSSPEASPSTGEGVFSSVCAGCHAYGIRLIGPPLTEIQEKYRGHPEGIVAFASNPKKVRSGYPMMPSQDYLGAEKLKMVADYILGRTHQ